MQQERHQRLGGHSAAVITIAKSHQVSVDELMHSMRELVDSADDFEPQHDGHRAAVEAAAALPALTRITWPQRPASRGELAAEQQAKTAAAEAVRVKAKLEAREADRKRKADAAELAQVEHDQAALKARALVVKRDAEQAEERPARPEPSPGTTSKKRAKKKTTKRKS